MEFKHPLEQFVEKLRNSREFTISLLVHIIFVAVFGGTVLFQAAQEPPDFEGEGGFVAGGGEQLSAPPQPTQQMPQTQDITVTATPVNTSPINAITTTATSPMNFNMTQMVMAPPMPTTPSAAQMAAPKPVAPAGGMSGETQVPTILKDRKLAAPDGAPITSLTVFNLDGEKNDASFNALRIFR